MQAQKEATLLCTRQIQQTIAVVYMHMVKTIIEPVAFLQAGKKGILLTETMCIMWGGGGGGYYSLVQKQDAFRECWNGECSSVTVRIKQNPYISSYILWTQTATDAVLFSTLLTLTASEQYRLPVQHPYITFFSCSSIVGVFLLECSKVCPDSILVVVWFLWSGSLLLAFG